MARGSVQHKGGDRWEVSVSLGTDPVTGRRRRRSRTCWGSRQDAERLRTVMLGEVDAQTVTPTTGTVGQVLAAWMELVGDDLSPTTRRRYDGIMANYLRPRWGEVRLTDLRVADLDLWYRSLVAGGLAPSTVRQIHAVLRRALAQAVKWDWIRANPAGSATLPRVIPILADPPAPAELRAVLDDLEVHDPLLLAIAQVAATTGMRRSELCALRWSDVDIDHGEIHVRRALVQTGRVLTMKLPKTNQQRRLAIDGTIRKILAAHRERVDETAEFAGTSRARDGYVFSRSVDGSEPCIPDGISQAWRRACERVGVEARLHDLRHFTATELLAAGVDIRTVSARLGHAKTSTTLDIYAHKVSARDQDAADVMGRLI